MLDHKKYGVWNKYSEYKFDVQNIVQDDMFYMLDRLMMMTKIKGLPNTIPERDLKLMLLTIGFACFAEVPGKGLYAFFGGLGGERNAYYMPTICTVANPYLKFNEQLKIDEDCVIVPNDSMYMGVIPLLNKYLTLLADNTISMRMVDIISRAQSLITAGDDTQKAAADKFIKDLIEGKFSSVAENRFLEGIKVSPMSDTGSTTLIKNLIEYHQYTKGSMWNELGIGMNYNMKREAIGDGEASRDDDVLLTFIDNMIETQNLGFEKVNKMFGTNITVEKSSGWAVIAKEQEVAIEEREEEREEKTQEVKAEEVTEEIAEDDPETSEEYMEEKEEEKEDETTE